MPPHLSEINAMVEGGVRSSNIIINHQKLHKCSQDENNRTEKLSFPKKITKLIFFSSAVWLISKVVWDLVESIHAYSLASYSIKACRHVFIPLEYVLAALETLWKRE